MSKKSSLLSVFAAIFALCLMVATPALAHHADDHAQGGGNETTTSDSDKGSENTPGNDRKEGYEDNSTTPQETNHGKGADNDGDADSDPSTAQEDDHTTSDAGDNAHPSGKDRSVENGGSGNQGKAESNPDDSKGPMRYEGVQGDDKPGGPGGTDLADQDGNNGCGNDDDFDDDNNGWCGKPTRVQDNNVKTCPAGTVMGSNGKCETPKTCPAGTVMGTDGKCDEVKGSIITTPPGPCDADNNMANGIQACEPKPCDADNNMANGIQACGKAEVLPDLEVRPSAPEDDVLGVRFSAAPALGAAVAPAVTQAAPAAQGAVLPFTGGSFALVLTIALALMAAGITALRIRKEA